VRHKNVKEIQFTNTSSHLYRRQSCNFSKNQTQYYNTLYTIWKQRAVCDVHTV